MDREPDAYNPEYEPNLEDERTVPLDDDAELELPPPTVDPDERVETSVEDGDIAPDEERPA